MRLGPVRARCTRLLAELGVEAPADVDRLASHLGERRGRPIKVLPHRDTGSPSGVWIAATAADYVFYDEVLTGMHREHVVAHELAHIAFGHGSEVASDPHLLSALLPDLNPRTLRLMLERDSYSKPEELEAETFASLLLQLSNGGTAAGLPDAVRTQALGMAATFGSRRDRLR